MKLVTMRLSGSYGTRCACHDPGPLLTTGTCRSASSASLASITSLMSVHTADTLPSPPSQRVAYVYKAKREIKGSKFRVMWGCV